MTNTSSYHYTFKACLHGDHKDCTGHSKHDSRETCDCICHAQHPTPPAQKCDCGEKAALGMHEIGCRKPSPPPAPTARPCYTLNCAGDAIVRESDGQPMVIVIRIDDQWLQRARVICKAMNEEVPRDL